MRQLAGASGFPSFAQEFDPYGNNTGFAGRGNSHYGFAGEWIDSTGLQYLRARYYSPAQGRFISRDPFPGLISQPASLNPYAYALNNPVLYTDPSGENPFLLVGVLGGVLGGSLYGYGSQVIRNLNQGLCFWDALSTNINASQVALYTGVGALFGLVAGAGAFGVWWIGAQAGWWGGIITGTYTVYWYLVNGVPRYIGQSSNFIQRAQYHLETKGWLVEPIKGLQRLSSFDARAVEQVLIEFYGLENLYNKIFSVSVSNPLYPEAIKRGREILNSIGFFR